MNILLARAGRCAGATGLACALALALTAPADGQSPKVNVYEGFEFPGRAAMPNKVQRREWTRFDQKGTKAYKVWAADEGHRPLKGPRPDAPAVPGLKLAWMQECYVFDEQQGDKGGTDYLFVGTSADGETLDKPLGWVRKDVLVLDDEALAGVTTDVKRKAMIVNTPESLKAGLELFVLSGDDEQDLEDRRVPARLKEKLAALGVRLTDKAEVDRDGDRWAVADPGDPGAKLPPRRFEVERTGSADKAAALRVCDSFAQAGVYDGPRAGARRRATFQLFNLFFVYAETNGFVLLGTSHQLKGDGEVVRGWIPRDRVAFWNTREGFQWDRASTEAAAAKRRAAKGMLFESPADAYRWDRGEKTAKGALFTEALDQDGVSRPYRYDDPRFVCLDFPDDRRFPNVSVKSNNRLYRVGGVGSFEGEGMGEAETQKLRRKLEEAEASLRRLELLFVIDDTNSMAAYFEPVGEAVEGILKEAIAEARKAGGTVSVAVSYYSDEDTRGKDGKPAPVRAEPLRKLIAPEIPPAASARMVEELCKRVKGHSYTQGGDKPEMVYDGIVGSVERANFSRGDKGQHARKVVVVIGDHCDKSKEAAPDHAGKDRVVRCLFPRDTNAIELYAIQMEKRAVSRDAEAVLFESQMRGLCDRANARAKDDVAAFARAESVAELKKAIFARYAEIERKTKEWRPLVAGLRRGEFASLQSRVGPGLIQYLREQGVPVERLKTLRGAQPFQQAYVWEFAAGQSDVKQLRQMVLLSRAQVEEMARILGPLAAPAGDAVADVGKLKELYHQTVAALTGDPKTTLTLAEAAYKTKGLQFTSPLLGRKAGELKDLYERERAELRAKAKRLRDVLDDVHVEYEVVREVVGRPGKVVYRVVDKGRPQPLRRYFTLPGDTDRWYWLDLEQEIP